MTGVAWAAIPTHVGTLLRSIWARPRLVLWLEVALVLYTVMVLAAPPAAAAPPNPLEALDRRDASGYLISNYNLEYLTSVTAPGESMTAWIVKMLWEGYRWAVGGAALIIDLTLGFGWLEYLIYPVEQVAMVLDDMLDQLPLVRELLILLAVGVGVARMWFGQAGRGLMDMAGSLTAWGVTAAIVVNPVTWLTGPDGILTRTQEAAQQFSAQLVNPAAAAGEVTPEDASGSLAEQLASTFVRAPHQYVAYGGLADGGGCETTYNDNLTESGKTLAEEMSKCSPDFSQTIEHPSATTFVTVLIILVGAAILIVISMLCSAYILLEILNILIAGLLGVWELFRAVGPGGSYRGLLGLVIDVLGSIVAMMLVILLEALYLAAVHYFLTNWDANLIALFLLVDVLLVVVIAVIIKQRRKLRRHFERMKERSRAQKAQATQPKRLPAFGHGGIASGMSTVAGHKVAHKAGQVGSRLTHGGARVARGAGSTATAPVRAATRRVSRPGFMNARLATGMAKQAGIRDRVSLGALRGLAYKGGERKWRKTEVKRDQRREAKAERRQRAKHWTWAGATRDADRRAAEQQETSAAQKSRRPKRRAVPQATEERRKGRFSRRRPPAPQAGPHTAARRGRSAQQTTDKKGGRPAPARRGNASSGTSRSAPRNPGEQGPASERLRQKMRTKRRSSPGPQRASRSLRRARRRQKPREGAA